MDNDEYKNNKQEDNELDDKNNKCDDNNEEYEDNSDNENNEEDSNDNSNTSDSSSSNYYFCGDIPGGFQTINPEIFNIIAEILGDVVAGRIPFNVQNAIGNWIQLVGQAIETYNTQQDYFQSGPGRYYSYRYYNVENPFCPNNGDSSGGSNSSSSDSDNSQESSSKSDMTDLKEALCQLKSQIESINSRLEKIEKK